MEEKTESPHERETREAVETFIAGWSELPTLIRASFAAVIVHRAQEVMNNSIAQSRACVIHGMQRRSNVNTNFCHGADAVIGLFAALANAADAEAVDLGIDKLGGTRLPVSDIHIEEASDGRDS